MKYLYNIFIVLFLGLSLLLSCAEKETTVEVSSVSLNTATIEMVEGETYNLVATVLPKDAEYGEVIWSSSNPSVASVDYGIVTAIKEGSTIITASAGGKFSTCSVTVSAKEIPVTSISIDKASLSMKVGETENLTATVYPVQASGNAINWTSSDEAVATVTDGKVTALKAGEATITAQCGGKTAECHIAVYVDATGVTISRESLRMMSGDRITLTAKVVPEQAINKKVTWSSSDESVVVVDNGVVTAQKEGSAKVTVATEDGQFSATCSVTVTDNITSYVSSSYNGGSMMISNDLIQYGSKLNFSVSNSSTRSIKVKSVQLIDGVTNAKGNVMSINHDIKGGSSATWTITIGVGGIHKPIARFVYEYNGAEYSTQAQYYEVNINF